MDKQRYKEVKSLHANIHTNIYSPLLLLKHNFYQMTSSFFSPLLLLCHKKDKFEKIVKKKEVI